MAHFVGKLDFNSLIGVKIADVEIDGQLKKCIVLPIKDNDIVQWKGELQLWFRAIAYRSFSGRFTHFLMKFIPRSAIRRLSANQLEAFANHKIGGLIRTDVKEGEATEEIDTVSFIQNNI